MNMGMVHSIIGSGLVRVWVGSTHVQHCTLHGKDCKIPLPESRLVCIPSLVLQKIKDVIPYIQSFLCTFYSSI